MERIPIIHSKYELNNPYFIQDDGKVYTGKYHRYLSTSIDRYGYEKVCLVSTDGKRHRYSVHRLVLENFKPVKNMENLQVNHIDGNKLNNNLSNLEWTTASQNIQHAFKIGLKTQSGELNNLATISNETARQIAILLTTTTYTQKQISEICGCSEGMVQSINTGRTWFEITRDIFKR